MKAVEVEEQCPRLQKMAWDTYVTSDWGTILNDLGTLKKWQVSLWWGLRKLLSCQPLRERWHSSVNFTSGRTKREEIAKSLLISTKVGWFFSIRKDWWGHILYLIFCNFFLISVRWSASLLYFTNQHILYLMHSWFRLSPLECQKAWTFQIGSGVLKNLLKQTKCFFSFCSIMCLKILSLPILWRHS